MKALIIGGAGFVGKYLIEHLSSQNMDIYATKLESEKIEHDSIGNDRIFDLDILNREQVFTILEALKPDYLFHLAAQSSVSVSWREPALTYKINVIGTVNVLEAVRKLMPATRVLLVGSAEQYGLIKKEDLPVKESKPLKPANPYAVSKTAQEMTGIMYSDAFGLDIIMVRAFNHIGPGQVPTFVIPDFAKQIAEIEKGLREPVMHVGNIDIRRDFSDVRDIVNGYWTLMQKGCKGEVYNIGSGKSYCIRDLLYSMIALSSCDIEVKTDPSKFRKADIAELRADISRIKEHTGWAPVIDIDVLLRDVLNYWRLKC